ncbi:MAG TPA: CPBP family intramembrane metalloprotease [Armatimonadetes bacterium]|nr:CPBP family intramembrane metalloprotease [Armatimonadota bacterium]
MEKMPPRRLLTLALAVDVILLLLAALWSWWGGIPVWSRIRLTLGGLAGGLVGAGGMMLMNYGLVKWAVRQQWQEPRRWIEELFQPLFSGLNLREILIISLGAGFAEEILFRGVVQPSLGWITASLLFGCLHVPQRKFLSLGAWATGQGLYLGGLYLLTGNLLVPMLTHALYDAAALSYLRYIWPWTRQGQRFRLGGSS